MNLPANLNKGDTVWIVTPAKALPEKGINEAIEILASWGLKVKTGKNVYSKNGGFGGNDNQRLSDIQHAINDPSAKAIFMSRGGYGSVRIIDELNFEPLITKPKWIIGYSDITYFHLKLSQLNLASLHATMPLEITFDPLRKEAIEETKQLLFGAKTVFDFEGNNNKDGLLVGEIVGGNLNIVHGNLGNIEKTFWNNKILFLEEVGEEMYAVDRMLYNLKRAEVFEQVQGVLLGGFSSIKDTNNWFPNQAVNDVLGAFFMSYKKPIAFSLNAGHIVKNWPILFGVNGKVTISKNKTEIMYLNGKTH